MGYTTDFFGEFTLDRPLLPEHKAYLEAFAGSRRVKRDADIAEALPDPVRIAAGLPIGFEGAYFVGTADKNNGQDKDESVIDGNNPPGVPTIPYNGNNPLENWGQRYAKEQELKQHALDLGLAQPGLWCQWVPNNDGTAIVWDEGEKFYEYVAWIEYIVEHFISRWGYVLNGEVNWTGEDSDDRGIIKITDNEVKIGTAVVSYRWS
jgi:hypothetical protein